MPIRRTGMKIKQLFKTVFWLISDCLTCELSYLEARSFPVYFEWITLPLFDKLNKVIIFVLIKLVTSC